MRRALAILLVASSHLLAQGGGLDAVRKAAAEGRYEEAQADLSRILAADPANREALAIQVDLATRRWEFIVARRAQTALLTAQGVANIEQAVRADCDRWVDRILEIVQDPSVDAMKYLSEGVEIAPSPDRLSRIHDAWVAAAARKLVEGLLAGAAQGKIAVLDFQAEGGGASARGAAVAEAVQGLLAGRAKVCPRDDVKRGFREARLLLGEGSDAVKLVAEKLAPWAVVRGTIGSVVKADLLRGTDLSPIAHAEVANPFSHAEDRTLQLEIAVAGQKTEKGQLGKFDVLGEAFQLADGSALRDFDKFQVKVQVGRPAHVYVLLLSSALSVERLFPDPTVHLGQDPDFANPIAAGRRCVLPADGWCYYLDDQPGVETLFVFASVQPIADLDRLVERMRAAAKEGNSADAAALARDLDARVQGTRGIGGVSEGSIDMALLEGKSSLKAVAEVVAGFDVVSRKFTIRHVKR